MVFCRWFLYIAHVALSMSLAASASLSRRLQALEQTFPQTQRRSRELIESSRYVSPHSEDAKSVETDLPFIEQRDENSLVKAAEQEQLHAKSVRRQLSNGELCSNHSTCDAHEYCMDCGKCREFHESLSADQQKRWTCDPCSEHANNHCESGRYCHRSQDSVDGECPSFHGCRTHSECPNNEYCFSCDKCNKYIAETGHRDELWECEPCPTTTGGFCGLISWCSLKDDSIDGECPPLHGCSSHTDCWNGLYCESCEKCSSYQLSLPEHQRAHWSCAPCQTVGGGFCEQLRFCQIANDGIDGTCPMIRGCSSDIQCLPNEYCSDCSKCNLHRNSLPFEDQSTWTCDPCPTERGGSCRPTQFCMTAEDSKEGVCPHVHGCGAHSDCSGDDFCLSWDSCVKEIGQNCGAKPEKGGVCMRGHLCMPERSITGQCPVPAPCGGHDQCSLGFFCAPWKDCVRRDPSKCGQKPLNREGVCLPLQHCTRGLHAPVDGICPVHRRVGGRIQVREGLRLSGGVQLATHHQAINSWPLGVVDGTMFSLNARIKFLTGAPTFVDGNVIVYVNQTNHSLPRLEISYKLFGMEASSQGGLHIHTGSSCDEPGNHFWASEELSSDPWTSTGVWISDENGIAEGSFSIVTGLDYRQNSGRAVVVHASNNNQIACGVLAEEYVVAQLHDFGNQSKGLAHDDAEYVGIYRVASGLIHEHLPRIQLSCPSVEITVPSKPGFFFEARIHLTDAEMSTRHAECSCIQREGTNYSCIRGAEVRYGNTEPRMLSKLLPVSFIDGGVTVSSDLTLYSLAQNFVAHAVLVDTSLENIGEGDGSLGCPALGGATSGIQVEPSLEELRTQGKVLPSGHVTGSWCVVRLTIKGSSGCSTTAKYKLCVASGALGVIFLQEANIEDDTLSQIALMEDSLENMVPVISLRYDKDFLNAVEAKQRPRVAVGPDYRVPPSDKFLPSRGGIRVYDMASGLWYPHEDIRVNEQDMLLSQEWMQFSNVRDVLFVCTSNHQIIALDASSPKVSLPLLGYAVGIECHASPLFRDYHVAEIKRGDSFYTIVIDPNPALRNRIYIYDTTSLSSWRLLSEIHANWEFDKEGLGQVIVHDGKHLVATWHCSTLYCGGQGPPGSKPRGERLYIMDLTDISSGIPPPVVAVTNLPMSKGSIVRDIACSKEGICLVSLSWDGLLVVDLAEGPNQFQVVGQHSATFNQADFPEHLSYLRMVSGAQRIARSATHSRRFYVESWSMYTDLYLAGATLGDSIRFDNLWVVDLEEYFRPVQLQVEPHEASVHATLHLAISMDEVLARMPGGKVDDLERLVAAALQRALNVDGQRIVVTGAKSSPDRQSVLVDFHIVPGVGATPDTLFNMLQRQLENKGSAIHTGVIAPYTDGAYLQKHSGGHTGISDDTGNTNRSFADPPIGHEDESTHMFIMMMITAVCIIVAVWAVAFGFRARRTAKLAVARANALAAQVARSQTQQQSSQQPEVAPILTTQEQAQTPESLGYVIGRPGDSSASSTVPVTSGPSAAYVVGTPIDPRRRSAQNAATAGLALTDMDTQKLVSVDEDDPSTNSPRLESGTAPIGPTTPREPGASASDDMSISNEHAVNMSSSAAVDPNIDSRQPMGPNQTPRQDTSQAVLDTSK